MRSPATSKRPRPIPWALFAGAVWLATTGTAPSVARADAPATGAPIAAAPDAVAFKFNPPDGFTAVETVKSTTVRDMSFLGKHTDERVSTAKWSFRKIPKGYAVTQTEVGVTMKQDGENVTTPTMASTLNVPVTYEVGPGGKLLAIHGIDKLSEKIQATLPPAIAKALSALISQEALTKTATAEWNRMIDPFADRTAKVGESWRLDGPIGLPQGGLAPHHSTYQLAERVDRAGRKLVRVRSSFTAEPGPLQDVVSDLMGKQLAAAGAVGAQLNVSDVESSGTLDRVMDPSTLFDDSATMVQTLKFTMEIPGQGKSPFVITTTRESTMKPGGAHATAGEKPGTAPRKAD